MTTSKNINTIGGKARNLIVLKQLGFNVPEFMVLPYELLYSDSAVTIDSIIDSEIQNAESKRYAVRSSADIEDGADHSFAGVFSTELNVPYEGLLSAITSVFDSGVSDIAKTYLNAKGIDQEVNMSVIVQEMIDADVSGVAFSRHPINTKKGILINSVFGLGEALVSGAIIADQFVYDNENITSEIANKTKGLYPIDGGQIGWKNIDSNKSNAVTLDNDQVKEIAQCLDTLRENYGHDVDIEFAIKDSVLYLLQVRPITTTGLELKKDNKIIWDNSNIIESYPGITSPLTFSFVKHMYEVVYTQFAGLLGTSPKMLEESKETYTNMLGHLNGRVYYNLRSWYEALAMVPGYKLNAPFMEKMMGVKESFELEKENKVSKRRAWRQSIVSIFKLIGTFIGLKSRSKRFMTFSNSIIQEYKHKDYAAMSTSKIVNEYQSFETVLSHRWKAPLINDFFAMIFFGVLSKWTAKLIPQNPQCINDLLIGSQDIVSIEPMRRTFEIAKLINTNEEYKALFNKKASAIIEELDKSKFLPLKSIIDVYLSDFGDRCPEELKLETRTYTQNPQAFIELVQTYLDMDLDRFLHSKTDESRVAAEALCENELKGKIVKKLLFSFVLKNARYLISNRENLRFQRTKGYGVVRIIFDALATRFASLGIIEDPSDVYFLTKEEIFDFVKGTSVDTDLKRVIEARKIQYKGYASLKMKDRITTYGIVNDNDLLDLSDRFVNNELSGIGCCPGIVESQVTVVEDPLSVKSLDNTILVARFTDPGWVRLFPSASAIIVEKGSLLSHSAIVARELGIPCIVAVDGVMDTLSTGDTVIMDGSTGQISIVK